MPFVEIKVIEDVFTDEQKKKMVKNVSEAVIDVEGEGLRNSTHVVLSEVKSGDWAIGGKTKTSKEIADVASTG